MPRFPAGHVALERALSKLGLASRSEARDLIATGRVRVDGRVVTDALAAVVPERVKVVIDEEVQPSQRWQLIALHKPRGVVTTRRDPEKRPTVYDALGDAGKSVMPVGRLDLASSGLLLLTNDTRLSSWLTDPEHALVRQYVVTVRGDVSDAKARAIEEGIDAPISGRGAADAPEHLRAHCVIVRKRSARETHLIVELDEGRNREIRRLFDALGHEVTRLKRVGFGGIELGDLQPGAWREISQDELRRSIPGVVLGRLAGG